MDSDSDDSNEAWSEMIEWEIDEEKVKPPPALYIIAEFFRSNPELFKMPSLFDASFSKQEFEELDALLS